MKTQALFATALLLVACTDSTPNTRQFHGFNPLAQPKGILPTPPTASTLFSGGQFAYASAPQTGFFKQLPTSDATADRLLTLSSSVKVLSQSDPFTQVELDNGEIGWVLTSQLSPNAPIAPTAAASQSPLTSPPATLPGTEMIPSTIEP